MGEEITEVTARGCIIKSIRMKKYDLIKNFVEYLIIKGFGINDDFGGCDALAESVKADRFDIFDYLLSKGASLKNLPIEDYCKALVYFVDSKNWNSVGTMMLDNSVTARRGLCIAIKREDDHMIKCFLICLKKFGVSVNEKENECRALEAAVKKNNFAVVKVLVEEENCKLFDSIGKHFSLRTDDKCNYLSDRERYLKEKVDYIERTIAFRNVKVHRQDMGR